MKKNTQRRESPTGTSVIYQHDQDCLATNHHGHRTKCRLQKQHILRAYEYVKKCHVCWKDVCMPHPPSGEARIPWLAYDGRNFWSTTSYPVNSTAGSPWFLHNSAPTTNQKMAAFKDSLMHKHGGQVLLNKIQQDILDLSAKLHQMTEDNSSWFGNL